MMANSNMLSSLKRFTSCDISDALVKLKVPYGGYLHGLSMWSPERQAGSEKVFGPAYTVQMVQAGDTSSPRPSKYFVDTIPKDSVVFISQPKGKYSACWGGLMTTRARKLGAQGVVIDGNFRDVNEHREMGFPLFAKDIASPGSNMFTRSSAVSVPVKFTSETQREPTTINPGDIVVGDSDGVVIIPPAILSECLKLCEERWEIDEKTKEALENGDEMGTTIERFKK